MCLFRADRLQLGFQRATETDWVSILSMVAINLTLSTGFWKKVTMPD
jgi:hypothetical protein